MCFIVLAFTKIHANNIVLLVLDGTLYKWYHVLFGLLGLNYSTHYVFKIYSCSVVCSYSPLISTDEYSVG